MSVLFRVCAAAAPLSAASFTMVHLIVRCCISPIAPAALEAEFLVRWRLSQVTMKPGDMVLYEGASCAHGRPAPLVGRYMANTFLHVGGLPHLSCNCGTT